MDSSRTTMRASISRDSFGVTWSCYSALARSRAISARPFQRRRRREPRRETLRCRRAPTHSRRLEVDENQQGLESDDARPRTCYSTVRIILDALVESWGGAHPRSKALFPLGRAHPETRIIFGAAVLLFERLARYDRGSGPVGSQTAMVQAIRMPAQSGFMARGHNFLHS
jgi:hypothetical protein